MDDIGEKLKTLKKGDMVLIENVEDRDETGYVPLSLNLGWFNRLCVRDIVINSHHEVNGAGESLYSSPSFILITAIVSITRLTASDAPPQ